MNRPALVLYSDPDADSNRAVNTALDRMWIAENAGRREEAQAHFRSAVKMISERSPAQVERMERERGLQPR